MEFGMTYSWVSGGRERESEKAMALLFCRYLIWRIKDAICAPHNMLSQKQIFKITYMYGILHNLILGVRWVRDKAMTSVLNT